jgi:hypothetical protein
MRVENRIEALEERLRPRGADVVVITQDADGNWPADPPEAATARLVVCLHRQGILTDVAVEDPI